MEMYIEQGASRMDCELKIAAKYNRPFRIISEKEVRVGGVLGLFSKRGIQVEFYFSPSQYKSHAQKNEPFLQQGSMYYQGNSPYMAVPRHHSEAQAKSDASNLEIEKLKTLAAANNAVNAAGAKLARENKAAESSSQAILDMLSEIKGKIDNRTDIHPSLIHASKVLKMNDFSENYINGMIERMQKELSLDQLKNQETVLDHLLEWIGESINIYKEDANIRKPRIMVLVGPTGVGKTTTISKLAAIYGIGTDKIPAVDVRMITIDAFRICAKEQIQQIGDIMQIPVSCVVNRQDLRREITLHGDYTDLFFIDTIGKSPKDSSKLGEMKEILDGAGKSADFHLVISATTNTSNIIDIMRQFEPFNYKSVILSKLDETDHVGNIISALAEKRKSVSYITDGQSVPLDIKRASVVRFLINLDGFNINREKIEKRFPSGDADQFNWR